MEEMLVTRAEIVQPVLARCRLRKAVLGTLAVAGKAHVTCAAIGWEAKFLGIAEACLLRGFNESSQGRLHQIAETIVGIDEVVARVHVSVVLDSQCAAAGGRKNAQRLRDAVPRLQGNIEDLHEDTADIADHPFIKNLL